MQSNDTSMKAETACDPLNSAGFLNGNGVISVPVVIYAIEPGSSLAGKVPASTSKATGKSPAPSEKRTAYPSCTLLHCQATAFLTGKLSSKHQKKS